MTTTSSERSHGAGDVTAVVLSIGEPFLARALDSLGRQTAPPGAVVRVEGLSPFHRALNAGIAQVRTPFFVQVDADMALDPTALADLRACVAPAIGFVVGGLRDPLRGSIVGVKLYRTACAAAQPCPDSLTPAVDLADAIRARGWLTAHALHYRPGPRALWHTFGAHEPDYTPLYTFTKFRLLGARYRHWRNGESLRRLFRTVHASGHPAAPMAQAAAALGVFWDEARDALRPCAPSAEFERVQTLLAAPPAAPLLPPVRVAGDPRRAFLDHYRVGGAHAGDAAGFRVRFDALAGAPTPAAWAALVGLCRGALVSALEPPDAAADADALAALLPPDGAP